MLAPNGRTCLWENNVLAIGRAQWLAPERHYSGEPIDLDIKDGDLPAVLALVAQTGGATVSLAPEVQGRVTLKLTQVRWDQALEIVTRTNGLDWTRAGSLFTVRSHDATSKAPGVAVVPSRLEGLSVDHAQLKGIVKQPKGGYVALLEGPERASAHGRVGGRLHDGEITAIDAARVTFRSDAGAMV